MDHNLTTEGFNGGYMHDLLATDIAIDATLIVTRRVDVYVECLGKFTREMTVSDFKTKKHVHSVELAVGVQHERFLQMFREHLFY